MPVVSAGAGPYSCCQLPARQSVWQAAVLQMSTARRVHHLTGIGSPWLQGRNSSARGAIATYALSEAAVAVLTVAAIVATVIVVIVMSSRRTTDFEQKTVEDSRSSQGIRQEEASQITEELEAILPGDLQEALLTFDGDFRGPWLALRLEADANLRSDEIRRAYRQAVRSEHPDTSDFPNADERFERVRQAYAILKDDGSRELLLEAIAQDASSFNELSSMEAFSEQSGKRFCCVGRLCSHSYQVVQQLRDEDPFCQSSQGSCYCERQDV